MVAIQFYAGYYTGLSTDTKPVAPYGTFFFETDTGKSFVYDGSWVQKGSGGLVTYSNPANATAITGATEKMLGLAIAYTPLITGRLRVIVSGNLVSAGTSAVGNATTAKLYFGTGTAPANNAAVAGTAIGTSKQGLAQVISVAFTLPVTISGTITGLTIGTAVWIDASIVNAGASQTGTLTNIDVEIEEF